MPLDVCVFFSVYLVATVVKGIRLFSFPSHADMLSFFFLLFV